MTKLDKCWINCLRMWKWIAEVYDGLVTVTTLKKRWLKAHRFKQRIADYCFFCQYAKDAGDNRCNGKVGCSHCPARLVSKAFMCTNTTYWWEEEPKAFYRKIVKLYAIYRSQK